MGHDRRAPFPMAAGIFTILAAILLFSGCGRKENKEDDVVFYLNEEPVRKAEYEMLAKKNSNQILRNYSTEEVNQKDFWTTERNGEIPYKLLDEIVTEQLTEAYTLKQIAVEEGIIEDYTYEELMENKRQENEERADKAEDSEVLYGLTEFEDSSYYEYWYSNLEMQIKNQWIRDNAHVKEEQWKKYYDANQQEYRYDVGVKVLYAEIGFSTEEENTAAWELAEKLYRDMEKGMNITELTEKYPEVFLEELDLNSKDTQEGKSGAYTQRWETASALQTGEISVPYEQNGAVCMIQCLARTEQGLIPFEKVKDSIERYLQTQGAEEYIEEKKIQMNRKEGKISPASVICKMNGEE